MALIDLNAAEIQLDLVQVGHIWRQLHVHLVQLVVVVGDHTTGWVCLQEHA